jgi:hypothetical protein
MQDKFVDLAKNYESDATANQQRASAAAASEAGGGAWWAAGLAALAASGGAGGLGSGGFGPAGGFGSGLRGGLSYAGGADDDASCAASRSLPGVGDRARLGPSGYVEVTLRVDDFNPWEGQADNEATSAGAGVGSSTRSGGGGAGSGSGGGPGARRKAAAALASRSDAARLQAQGYACPGCGVPLAASLFAKVPLQRPPPPLLRRSLQTASFSAHNHDEYNSRRRGVPLLCAYLSEASFFCQGVGFVSHLCRGLFGTS